MVEFTYLVSVDILGGAKRGRLADIWRFFPVDVRMFAGSSFIHSVGPGIQKGVRYPALNLLLLFTFQYC